MRRLKGAIGLLWGGALLAQPTQNTARLVEFPKVDHDFGRIKEEDRVATTRFTFRNVSKHPVRVVDVKTSCGCTSPDWSKDKVAPGKEGFIEAQYSSWGRPGPFSKSLTVRIRSEKDTTQEETYTLTIRGEVIPRPKGPEDWYPTKLGNLWFGLANHIAIGNIKTNETKTQGITIYNASDKPIELQGFADVPAWVKITLRTSAGEVTTYTLPPKDTAHISCTYNAAAANDYGFVYHVIKLRTNDAIEPEKPIYITANIEEYFGELTEAALAEAPRAQFEATSYDYGKIRAGEKVIRDFRLTNVGKKPLIIRKVKASCGCTAVAPDKSTLQPGESTVIKVTFDSTGRSGRDSKSVTVITNDPRQPVVHLVLQGEIEPVSK